MARRSTTRHACTTCREKRRKCDGKTPCAACDARGLDCSYPDKSWKSKGSLRSEIDHLRKKQRKTDEVFHALKSSDQWATALQSLRRGDSVDTITRRLSDISAATITDLQKPGHFDSENAQSPPLLARHSFDNPRERTPGLDQLARHAGTVDEPDASSSTYRDSLSSSPSASIIDPSSESPPTRATTVSEPGRSPQNSDRGASSSNANDNAFLKTLFDLSVVQRHVNTFLHWECPLFAIVDREVLLRDFVARDKRHCSPSLVAAIMSLTTPLGEQTAKSASINPGYSADAFAQAAKTLMDDESDPDGLTVIQTMTLLALREISNGNLAEARGFANKCFEWIIRLCEKEAAAGLGNIYNCAAVAATFTGVISLARMITITACQLPMTSITTTSNYAEQTSPMDRHPPAPQSAQAMTTWSQVARQQVYPRAESALLFQLTELVYSCLAYVHRARWQDGQRAVLLAYQRCLNWYTATIATMEPENTCTPSVLFMHTYYHFCLLALFRPLLSHPSTANANINADNNNDSMLSAAGAGPSQSLPSSSLSSDAGIDPAATVMPDANKNSAGSSSSKDFISPRTICAEAAQAILSLADSHASLFSSHRAPAFLALFVRSAHATKEQLQHLDATGGSAMMIDKVSADAPDAGLGLGAIKMEAATMGGVDHQSFNAADFSLGSIQEEYTLP